MEPGEVIRCGRKAEEVLLDSNVNEWPWPGEDEITSGVKKGMPMLRANFLSVEEWSPLRPAASPTKNDPATSDKVVCRSTTGCSWQGAYLFEHCLEQRCARARTTCRGLVCGSHPSLSRRRCGKGRLPTGGYCSLGQCAAEIESIETYGSGYERNLLLPVVYQSSCAERLIGDDDDGVAEKSMDAVRVGSE